MVITHRPSLLKLVDRIILVDGRRIAADRLRDEMIRRRRQPAAAPAAA